MVAIRAFRSSRSVAAGISPISDTPLSLRRISIANSGGTIPPVSSTDILSITRLASTIPPETEMALKRAASEGASPSRITCSPSAITLVQS